MNENPAVQFELSKAKKATDIFPGNPGSIWNSVRAVKRRAADLDAIGAGLKVVDAGEWEGPAAVRFRGCFDHQPKRWLTASDRFDSAAKTLDEYAHTLDWAQKEAAEAIALWKEGVAKTEASGLLPAGVPKDSTGISFTGTVFTSRLLNDPGLELRRQAVDKVVRARRELFDAANDATCKLRDAASDAPVTPTLLDKAAKLTWPVGYYLNYLFGSGRDTVTNINSFNWTAGSLADILVPYIKSNSLTDGTYSVTPASLGDNGRILLTPDTLGKSIIGSPISVAPTGTLTISGNSWEFTGSVSSPSADDYDFDTALLTGRPARELGPEVSTWIGYLGGVAVNALPTPDTAQVYKNYISGSISIHESGTIN
ncbi:putative T7SS-secreted protein [Actinokineospora bangkokensis]|uniref:putative T7SS-secreted protein n=1 Tax=Actinokineospora bangkokensis TaxID=1193682 RepID=UPI000AD2D833|nr:hypothetical protein [Actinokineospora bangkokensis]